jgi:hypothetical protein
MQPTSATLDTHVSQLPALLAQYGYQTYPTQFATESDDLGTVDASFQPTAGTLGQPTTDSGNYKFGILLNNRQASGWQTVDSSESNPSRVSGGASTDPLTVFKGVMALGLSYNPTFIELTWPDASQAIFQSQINAATLAMGGTLRP